MTRHIIIALLGVVFVALLPIIAVILLIAWPFLVANAKKRALCMHGIRAINCAPCSTGDHHGNYSHFQEGA